MKKKAPKQLLMESSLHLIVQNNFFLKKL